ncbi:MAG: hypothetical protein WD045_17450 [Pirellulaceae bacterium]
MDRNRQTIPELGQLVGLFYENIQDLGGFEEVSAEQTPPPFHQLLAHNSHMTVTVEQFHHSAVNVQVLDKRTDDPYYSRKILLRRQTDGKVVQYGIVRLNCDFLQQAPTEEIKSERTPLGRVLIQHNVLREVQLTSLWRIAPGEELRNLLGLAPGQTIYGRTALIYCNGEPAVELLEIVTPD